MAKGIPAPATNTVTITYTAGANPPITVDQDKVPICPGGTLSFKCDQANFVIVCKYKENGNSPSDHTPFDSGDFVLTAHKQNPASRKVKSATGTYHYAIVVVPDDGTLVPPLDPTIIIKQTL